MEGEEEPALDLRLLMMKSCVWCASVDPLMKGKQRHAFPSLALISPLSGGVANASRRRLDGGRRAADGGKKAWNQRKTKREGGGGRLFVFAFLL